MIQPVFSDSEWNKLLPHDTVSHLKQTFHTVPRLHLLVHLFSTLVQWDSSIFWNISVASATCNTTALGSKLANFPASKCSKRLLSWILATIVASMVQMHEFRRECSFLNSSICNSLFFSLSLLARANAENPTSTWEAVTWLSIDKTSTLPIYMHYLQHKVLFSSQISPSAFPAKFSAQTQWKAGVGPQPETSEGILCRFLILLVKSWRIVVISGTVHRLLLKYLF